MKERFEMKPVSGQNAFLIAMAVSLSSSVLYAVAWSLRWPLVGDASLLHYVVFLIGRGMKPYQQIVDINLPGSYFFEAAAMRLFGCGALGWRIYDLVLLMFAGGAAILLTRRTSWFAGFFAAGLFALIHIQDGIAQLGQRDLLIAVLLLWAYVLLFSAQRRQATGLLIFLFALLIGVTLTIKPSMLLIGFGLLLVSATPMRRAGLSRTRHFGFGLLGLVLPAIVAAFWLRGQQSLVAFVDVATNIIPLHARLGRRSLAYLFAHSTSPIAVLCALWLVVLSFRRPKLSLERTELLIGILGGLLSYMAQGKGYPYHRYSFLLLLLVLIGRDMMEALSGTRVPQSIAAGALAYGCLLLAPHAARLAHTFTPDAPFEQALSDELKALGPQTARGVQCLDTFGGCINTLYDLRLVQSTGYLYDCYLFTANQNATTARYRAGFLAAYQTARPGVIVLTNQFCFGDPAGFHKLDQWPAFREELAGAYQLSHEWKSPTRQHWWVRAEDPTEYRIYLRKAEGVAR